MNKDYSTICDCDETGKRRIHVWTEGDYSILEENLDGGRLPEPGSVFVLINGDDSRSIVLRTFDQISSYLQECWPEELRTLSDLLDYEEEEEIVKLEKYERADEILSNVSQHLSKEDLQFVEQAMRTAID